MEFGIPIKIVLPKNAFSLCLVFIILLNGKVFLFGSLIYLFSFGAAEWCMRVTYMLFIVSWSYCLPLNVASRYWYSCFLGNLHVVCIFAHSNRPCDILKVFHLSKSAKSALFSTCNSDSKEKYSLVYLLARNFMLTYVHIQCIQGWKWSRDYICSFLIQASGSEGGYTIQL